MLIFLKINYFFYLIKHFPLYFTTDFEFIKIMLQVISCALLYAPKIQNTEKGMWFFIFKRKSFHCWNCLFHLRLSGVISRFWFTRFTSLLSGKHSANASSENWENWRGFFHSSSWEPTLNSKAKRPGSFSAAKKHHTRFYLPEHFFQLCLDARKLDTTNFLYVANLIFFLRLSGICIVGLIVQQNWNSWWVISSKYLSTISGLSTPLTHYKA